MISSILFYYDFLHATGRTPPMVTHPMLIPSSPFILACRAVSFLFDLVRVAFGGFFADLEDFS